MKFTDRYIKVPIELVNRKLSELTGGEKDEFLTPTFAKLNPFDISYYYPTLDGDKLIKTEIVFKNGDNLVIEITIQEFECLLNEFNKQ